MKARVLSLFVFALFVSVISFAQTGSDEQPPLDVFAGYSHSSNFDTGLNGWILSANYNLGSSWLGIEGDFSGHYGSHGLGGLPIVIAGLPSSVHTNLYNYDFGPRVTWRSPSQPFNAFGHLLFGGSHASVSASGVPSVSDTSFSWVLGGGADYNFNANWAGRAQLDLLHTNFFSNGESHPRFSIGIVYRLGTPR
ncbi:MAG TPA: outer membrane beta-barrel protein [Candidatus Angelobacter sp.]|jgi:opacity protein-like surface antigen|nr:outer membrane beta-barrel protein [Candidatus Angelobacter sp.]